MGASTLRRPLPDAPPRWCSAPKPLVVALSARAPCDGSAIPRAARPAQSARSLVLPQRGADVGGPVCGPATVVRRSEGCLGAGDALRAGRRLAVRRVARDWMERLQIRAAAGHMSKARGLTTHQRPKSYNILHSPHKHSTVPTDPHFAIARQPQNGQKHQNRLAALVAPRRRTSCPRAFASQLTPL